MHVVVVVLPSLTLVGATLIPEEDQADEDKSPALSLEMDPSALVREAYCQAGIGYGRWHLR